MKCFYLLSFLLFLSLSSTAQLAGYVFDDAHKPIAGATVSLVRTGHTSQTDTRGFFNFEHTALPDSLQISYLGYRSQRTLQVVPNTRLRITLLKDEQAIEVIDIVNTGFYQIPKERATGAFTVVDNKLLNRAVGGNILQRLEAVSSGVQFVNAGGTNAADIRVRGLATIVSDATPLIVLDNFPYEGDINSINPSDIETITILKDAAASSIWGAQAGNGVIVITTKQGRYNQKGQLHINSNLTHGMKPDLLYNQNRLPSATVMEIEKEKYEKGTYYLDYTDQRPFPEYVEMLIARDNGLLSEADFLKQEELMKATEVREEAMKYLYQSAQYQQYALNARGGGNRHTYFLSGGYDRNRADIIGNSSNRINLNLQNTFKPTDKLELMTALWYSEQQAKNNGLALSDLASWETHVGLSPYLRLKDVEGNNLPIISKYRQTYVDQAVDDGLLDWSYTPLEDRSLLNRRSKSDELRANAALRYTFWKYFNLYATYQYVKGNTGVTEVIDKDSFYLRDMVNNFTLDDGTQMIPYGGMLKELNRSKSISHSGRMQLNYAQNFLNNHEVSTLLGAEIRNKISDRSPDNWLYNYDEDLRLGTRNLDFKNSYPFRPYGYNLSLPRASDYTNRFVDRYLSYFGNAAYHFKERYGLSGSMRWDGSNLFGVKTNQKGTPLWSIGGSWELSREPWYKLSMLEYLRMRITYGSAGNVNKDISSLPTIAYRTHATTGERTAEVRTPGNPFLKWERVATINVGLDYRLFSGRLSGSIDYFRKNAADLIGVDVLPAYTGVEPVRYSRSTSFRNYADLKTAGLDIVLNTANIRGNFSWNSVLLLNRSTNRVTNYKGTEELDFYSYLGEYPVPLKGYSRDMLFALPWHGLDPETGYVRMLIDGEPTTNYKQYYDHLEFSDLHYKGSRVPTLFGSLRNDFLWKGFNISFLLSWKTNYVYREKSMISVFIRTPPYYHMDYLKRWQQPGDEKSTYVAAVDPKGGASAHTVYQYAEMLVEKGDHIRLQDITFSYDMPKSMTSKIGLNSLRLYAQARHLGLLWKATSKITDPDYIGAEYVQPKQFSLGMQLNF